MDTITRILLRHQQRNLEMLYPLLPEDACMQAAAALLAQPRANCFIATGFYCFTQGETDGPIGSHFLAKALQTLGYAPAIVTDRYSAAYFQGQTYPTLLFAHDSRAEELLQAYRPCALIAVERCGRAADGRYYSMRKKDISAQTPPVDALFLQKPLECLSIGIGDGGNEIGMGAYAETLERQGGIIPSCVRTDHPIVATVSNWGAYGLIAALETHSGQRLLPSDEEAEAFLRKTVEAGAPDGIKGHGHYSTDGWDAATDREILQALRQVNAPHAKEDLIM